MKLIRFWQILVIVLIIVLSISIYINHHQSLLLNKYYKLCSNYRDSCFDLLDLIIEKELQLDFYKNYTSDLLEGYFILVNRSEI